VGGVVRWPVRRWRISLVCGVGGLVWEDGGWGWFKGVVGLSLSVGE